jgi:hypothetical protein
MPLNWFTPIGANVLGDSHLRSGVECQDAFSFEYSSDQEWLAVTVCDGAGSSKNSGVSSKFVSKKFSSELVRISSLLDRRPFGSWVVDAILGSLIEIRADLREIGGSDNLEDYHTTLLAVLLGPPSKLGDRAGLAVHIGDGAIFSARLSFEVSESINFLDDNFSVISPPENGEYANETYFLTETQWIKKIRITPIPLSNWIALATDGGCAVALNNNLSLRPQFLPVLLDKILAQESSDYASILQKSLSEPSVKSLTDDDKTFVLLLDKIVFESIDGSLAIKGSGSYIKPAGSQKPSAPNLTYPQVLDPIAEISEPQEKFATLDYGSGGTFDKVIVSVAVLLTGLMLIFLMMFLNSSVCKTLLSTDTCLVIGHTSQQDGISPVAEGSGFGRRPPATIKDVIEQDTAAPLSVPTEADNLKDSSVAAPGRGYGQSRESNAVVGGQMKPTGEVRPAKVLPPPEVRLGDVPMKNTDGDFKREKGGDSNSSDSFEPDGSADKSKLTPDSTKQILLKTPLSPRSDAASGGGGKPK